MRKDFFVEGHDPDALAGLDDIDVLGDDREGVAQRHRGQDA